jgi:hypothetical protein
MPTVADVPSGLSLTPPRETKLKKELHDYKERKKNINNRKRKEKRMKRKQRIIRHKKYEVVA